MESKDVTGSGSDAGRIRRHLKPATRIRRRKQQAAESPLVEEAPQNKNVTPARKEENHMQNGDHTEQPVWTSLEDSFKNLTIQPCCFRRQMPWRALFPPR